MSALNKCLTRRMKPLGATSLHVGFISSCKATPVASVFSFCAVWSLQSAASLSEGALIFGECIYLIIASGPEVYTSHSFQAACKTMTNFNTTFI